MKNISAIILLLFLATGFTFAQVAGKFNRAVNVNDTVIINLESMVGEIEWQKSNDSINWEVLEGVTNQLVFVADQTTFFRVITTVEGCNPYISDMGSVTVLGELTDIDGNVYKTVQIGNQVWMAENLRTTHFSDGSPIHLSEHDTVWAYYGRGETAKSIYPAFCWYKNDSATYAKSHGALYNWAAATKDATSSAEAPSGVQGVCPDGWHMPSDAEWKTLELALGMDAETVEINGWRGTDEGAKLAGESYKWDTGVLPAEDSFGESGFNGLPAGDRTWDDESIFYGEGVFGTWWTATRVSNGDTGWSRYITFDRIQIRRDYTYIWNGNSVRCVKD